MLRSVLAAVAALVLLAPAPALAGKYGGSSSSFSSSSRSSSSSSSKSYSSSGGSKSGSSRSSSSKSYSSSKTVSASKPSSGPVQQRAPVTKLVPPKPPASLGTSFSRTTTTTATTGRVPRVSIPSTRSYSRDRTFIVHHYQYADPYFGSYYGDYGSPYYYMWLGGIMSGGNDAPRPPEAKDRVSASLPSYLGIIQQTGEFMAQKATG